MSDDIEASEVDSISRRMTRSVLTKLQRGIDKELIRELIEQLDKSKGLSNFTKDSRVS